MCAFSNEVMGQKTEGWMEELLKVFHVLVDMISSPVHLQEACFSSHFWPFSSHFRSFSASFGPFSGDDGPFLAC